MAVRVLLLPSPLLPGAAYDDLVAALARGGVQTSLASAELRPGAGAPDLIERWAAHAGSDLLLVAHSNAGYLAPAVRGGGRQPIVFLDAALPPASGRTRLAPAPFRRHLDSLADDAGNLPPWTRWWPRADLAAVIPDARFTEIDATAPHLPLSYFDDQVTVPPGWSDGPNAYLALGDTYAEELAVARARRWPHARLDGGHLHFLHEPDAVAGALLDLAARFA